MPRHVLTALAAASLFTLFASAASAFPASPEGGRCGGIAGFRCQPGLVCQMPPGRGADRMGICAATVGPDQSPQACARIYRPVCGRDRRTYANDCEARRRDVPIAYPGRCRR